jgi:4-aminobutyrate aminotransferase/(S)-3-amino-2-methylpropionate transaminase
MCADFADRALGSLVYDIEGREYVDFSGGIGVLNVGHCHPRVVAAIQDQAAKLIHTCFHVMMYQPYVELADRMCRLTPGSFDKMAIWANSGAEAVENAVKAARYYTKRPAVICFEHAFHGRTFMGMSLTSKVKPYKFGFGPFVAEVYRLPAAYCYRCALELEYPSCDTACADRLEDMFVNHVAAESTACVIAEPVIGEGGFIVPPAEYFPKLARICRDKEILFVADEIQSGMGRTGEMFAIEHWGVVPDLITVAKSLAAGMPLSGVIGRKEILDAAHVGGLGGTYSGNPVCCRAALAVLDIFDDEDVLARSRSLGRRLSQRLTEMAAEFESIGEVRGLGPMMALELVKDRQTKEPDPDAAKALVSYCHKKGLILISCGAYGNVIRLLMPLLIGDVELERGLSIMSDGLRSLEA